MVLYRTYRPQKIADLDKTDVAARLHGIFTSTHIPHAFLFAGPKGTGKTSASRIVAKVLNCEKVVSGEPCNTCANCVAITNGMHMDVLEIDAASNRGIDEIRALRERVALSPSMGKKRVYIIDEVHMLTREAFNALLKTLEEPPSHVVFILATTELHKIPETIVSRCVYLTFSKATPDEIVHSLKRVVTGEKIKIDEKLLVEIAKASDGSFRDATKHLEQVISEGTLTSEHVRSLLGRNIDDKKLLTFIAKKDAKEALKLLQTYMDDGADLKQLIGLLLERLQRLLLVQYGAADSDQNDDIGVTLPTADAKRLIQLLSKAYTEMKTSFIESLPLEMGIIEWCSTSDRG